MIRDCASCGGRYTAKRSTSRFCSDRCRKRAQRAPALVLSAVPPLDRALSDDGPLTLASLQALEKAGVEDTPLGHAALLIARRLEQPSMDTGSSIAALVRTYRDVMQAALDRGKREDTPLNRLRTEYAARFSRDTPADWRPTDGLPGSA